MNLRQQLLAATELRSCTPYGTQQRNFSGKRATGAATAAQQTPANPHEIRDSDATGAATSAQHPSCAPATLTQPLGLSCATVAPDLDDRVTCTACRHLWPGHRCLNHRRADLTTRDLAADFAELPQRCPGFAPMARAQAPPAPTPKTEPQTDLDRSQTENTTVINTNEEPDMIVSENTTATFTPCPAGSYLARCVRIVDMGTQVTEYQGERKTARKVLVAFEVLDDETRRDDGQPFVLSKRYTLSLHEKAALRKDLASWRGRDFTTEELKGFDLKNVLNAPAFISVVEIAKDGKTFSNIASVMKPPKGMQAPQASEPLVIWDMAAPDWTAFAGLNKRIVEQIEASPEFKSLKLPTGRVSLAPPEPAGSGFDDMPNDLDDVAF